MAISFLVSAVIYRKELARKAQDGYFQPVTVRVIEGLPASWSDILINAFAGFFFVGKGFYANAHYEAFRANPASIILSLKFHWLAGIAGAV